MIQGMGGMMSVTGEPDDAPGGGPQRAGVPIADIITGMYASIAICAALAHRERDRRRASISISRCSIRRSRCSPTRTPTTSRPASRPSASATCIRTSCPTSRSAPRDGEVILACGNDNLYRKFCEAAGCAELASDPRFATNGKRVENRAELTRAARRSVREAHARANGWSCSRRPGVPNGPINDVAQVFEEPQVKARGMRVELEHRARRASCRWWRARCAFRRRRSNTGRRRRLLGQHTDEVLRELLGKERRRDRAAARGEGDLA